MQKDRCWLVVAAAEHWQRNSSTQLDEVVVFESCGIGIGSCASWLMDRRCTAALLLLEDWNDGDCVVGAWSVSLVAFGDGVVWCCCWCSTIVGVLCLHAVVPIVLPRTRRVY